MFKFMTIIVHHDFMNIPNNYTIIKKWLSFKKNVFSCFYLFLIQLNQVGLKVNYTNMFQRMYNSRNKIL